MFLVTTVGLQTGPDCSNLIFLPLAETSSFFSSLIRYEVRVGLLYIALKGIVKALQVAAGARSVLESSVTHISVSIFKPGTHSPTILPNIIINMIMKINHYIMYWQEN